MSEITPESSFSLAITPVSQAESSSSKLSPPPEQSQQMTRNLHENKLQRQLDLNTRLLEILDRNVIPASEACQTLLKYVTTTTDYLLPGLWGEPEENPYVPKSKLCGCIII